MAPLVGNHQFVLRLEVLALGDFLQHHHGVLELATAADNELLRRQ